MKIPSSLEQQLLPATEVAVELDRTLYALSGEEIAFGFDRVKNRTYLWVDDCLFAAEGLLVFTSFGLLVDCATQTLYNEFLFADPEGHNPSLTAESKSINFKALQLKFVVAVQKFRLKWLAQRLQI